MKKHFSFYVAGLKFHKYDEVAKQIAEGDSLHLEPEPTNKFDPFAVKLYYPAEEDHLVLLGHVPMKMSQSKDVSAALDHFNYYDCVVTKHNTEAPPYERVKVEVKFSG
jgi:hypothetical protein